MTDYLASAKELLAVVDNLHGDELDQAQDLERGASAHALVDIAESLRRLNDGRDQFHREVLEVLTQAKEPARCTAMRGVNPHDRCVHPDGHVEAARSVLHVDETGIAFSHPVGQAGSSADPSGAGATAQVVEKEGES
jgi:hypothetical protein